MTEHACKGCKNERQGFCVWGWGVQPAPSWLGDWPIDWDNDEFQCSLSPVGEDEP